MDEDEEDIKIPKHKSTDKLSRKVGEKVRRDRLNGLIAQLAEEVPTIRHAQRRLDKSAILRLTVSYLKLHQGLKRKQVQSKSSFYETGLLDRMKEITDGALFILAQSGTLLYVSPKVYEMLGYYQTDMIGYNLAQFVHPDDMEIFESRFTDTPCTLANSSFAKIEDRNGRHYMSDVEILETEKVSFYLRMLRANRKKPDMEVSNNDYELLQVQAHCEARKDGKPGKGDELWMVANMKLFRHEPIMELSICMSAFQNNNEWATMHDLDSKILSIDQRASLFSGYLASEVVGQTPYMLILDEDLECVALSHKLIMKDQEIPATVFRMKNRLDTDLYVKSRSIIINDRWTKQPKCIVSCNEILCEAEGSRLLQLQKQTVEELKALEWLKIREEELEEIETNPVSVLSVKSEKINDDKCCFVMPDGSLTGIESNRSPCLRLDPFNKDYLPSMGEDIHKSLCEVYDERARYIPMLLRHSESSSADSRSSQGSPGVKRSSDCLDQASCSGESQTSSIGETDHQNDSSNRPVTSALRQLLNSDRNSYQISKTSSQKSTSSSKPILQGLLESQDAEGHHLKTDTCEENEHQAVCSNLLSDLLWSESTHSSHSTELCNCSSLKCHGHCQSCQGSVTQATESIPHLQSPTVSSCENSIDTERRPDLRFRFTDQLETKHAQLSQTFTSQKATIEALRCQLDNHQGAIFMDTEQQQMHQLLIGRLQDAEIQMQAHDHLLDELEEEIEAKK